MKTILQLEKWTREEKLQAMEELWKDLSQDENEYASPAWHEDVLRAREEKAKEGKDVYIPWDQAKQELKDLRQDPST